MSPTGPNCPRCGHPGMRVPIETVEHMIDQAGMLGVWHRAMFCGTVECPVVYFDDQGRSLPKTAIRVRVFQKESGVNRPVCYCFDHSVSEVLAAVRADGSNVIVDEIMDACRRGLDRCEESNPQGRCCLGNIRELLRVRPVATCCGDGT